MTPQIARWRVTALTHGTNIRTDLGSEEELRRHGKAIRKWQRTPLLILPDGTVVDGNRTLAAARLEGLDELDCIVIDAGITPAQYKEIQWSAAVHRQDISAFDKAVAVRDIKAEHPEMSSRQLAEEVLHIDPAQVTKYLALFDCIPAVVDAARAGKLGVSDWYAISRSPDQGQALMQALNGATRADLEREGKRRRNGAGKAATVKAKSVFVVLPSGIAVQFKADSITLDMALDAIAEVKRELDAAKLKGHDARTLAPVMRKRLKEFKRDGAKSGGDTDA
jgi:ParB family transcriptional regulator, chromosome partitioning protein